MPKARFHLPIKIETATPLQLQVAEFGICPECHTKSLVLRFAGGGYRWNQCGRCRKVVVLDSTGWPRAAR
jgi:hypothetical protein